MTDYKKYEPFFNAWYIKKKIGSGSFGDVYEVERKEFDKVYRSALKIISIPKNEDEKRSLKEEIADDASLTAYYDSAVKSISDEMAIMSEVKGHTNIVSYEDHEVIKHEDGIGYDIIIRMELLTLLTDYQKKHLQGGRPPKLSVLDKLIIMLQYDKEYRVMDASPLITASVKVQFATRFIGRRRRLSEAASSAFRPKGSRGGIRNWKSSFWTLRNAKSNVRRRNSGNITPVKKTAYDENSDYRR